MKRSMCSRCERPKTVCYCHTLIPTDNYWPVTILQHPRESKHAVGTARIAALSLKHCSMQIGENFSNDTLGINEDQFMSDPPLLVYPGDDSLPLETLRNAKPQSLLFLDASWRKSRRVLLESPALMGLQKISFQPNSVSRYRIRKAPDRFSLSTLEAIVYVLSFLEKDEKKYQPLLSSMDWMIEKQIELMGKDVFDKNYSGYLKE